MSLKPCPRKKWIKFKHEIWDRPNNPLQSPVTFRPSDKDIPSLHIHTNLVTLGISHQEFNELVKKL